jgi:zinc transport system substrate-binding protein
MIDDVLETLCKVDAENADYYIINAENYKKQIQELDTKFEDLVQNSTRKEIAFAGEFSYSYFIKRYGLNFVTVYNNCGEGEDPSIAKVKSVIDYINNHNLPVVFYEELSEGTVAKIIGEETKTNSMVFYTIHNADIENDSYVKLMNKNYENLKEALN